VGTCLYPKLCAAPGGPKLGEGRALAPHQAGDKVLFGVGQGQSRVENPSRPLLEGEAAFVRRSAVGLRLGQNELAQRAGLDKGYLSAILNRRVRCTRAAIAKIAHGLGMDTIAILEQPL